MEERSEMKAVFDIETIAFPISEIESSLPIFDPESVKMGNTKDPVKVAERLKEAEKKHRDNAIRDAALNPLTSRCKLAGFMHEGETTIYCHETDPAKYAILCDCADKWSIGLHARRDEKAFLAAVTGEIIEHAMREDGGLVTYFGNEFDLPFVIKRAWLNGVPVSIQRLKRGRYFRENITDLYELWGFGERYPSTGGLSGLAKMLGCERQKTGDGSQFGDIYARDPGEGLAYLIDDLRVTAECAEMMGAL